MSKKNPQKKVNTTWISFILVFICFSMIMGALFNTNGSGSGDFQTYSGPVLPLTSLSGADGIEVTRDVDFDFSPYLAPNDYTVVATGAAGITDAYVLTNTTGESKQLELVYGFQASFIDHPDEFPVISLDGEPIQPLLYPSVDTAELVRHARNYDDFSRILEEQDFLTVALQKSEEFSIPVTAYHYTDLAYEGTEVAGHPMLTLKFSLDENTSVWAMGYDVAATDDDGRECLMFRVDRGEAWLFTAGGKLIDPEFGGNRDYNITEKSAIAGVTFQQEIFEANLYDMIRQMAQDYDYSTILDYTYTYLTPEILIDGAVKRFPKEDSVIPYGMIQTLDGLFHEVITEPRMMYLVFPVTLEPGQSMAVEASYIQEPCYDIGGPKHKREGYELATKLGSDLHFTDLGASLSHTESIELGKQNFGFDLEKGITDVALDLSVDRYYLEVKVKK
jgi:hypothetical protein